MDEVLGLDDGAVPTGAAAERIDADSIASVEFTLVYDGPDARHTARRFAGVVNLWRDVFPPGLDRALMGLRAGESVTVELAAGALVPPPRRDLVRAIPLSDFDGGIIPGIRLHPDHGRVLPQGVLHRAGIGGIYAQNRKPFRVLASDGAGFIADLNPPLAGRPVTLSARVLAIGRKTGDRGGRCQDWTEVLTETAGIEMRAGGRPTDFFARDWNARLSEADDSTFYAKPRLVPHIDARAIATISALYGRLVPEGARVLDLMSGHISHLPPGRSLAHVTGLGMNAEELAANPALDHRVVHDLNRAPRLPFETGAFDAAVCTVSIEYLTRPAEVMDEVARVLRPGAPFVVTVSNRYFPPKAIKLWIDAHPTERLGYMLELLLNSGRFERLETQSAEGYPRPADDPHAHETDLSDPVLAAWGWRMA